LFLIEGSYTYDKRGTSRIGATTTGNQKTRVSVGFCASADGTKLKPVILIPRVNPLQDYEPPQNVIVEYLRKATFNTQVMCDVFIKRCMLPEIYAKKLEKPTLIIDHAPCHLTKPVKDYMKSQNINTIYVPKRMTNLLQPADLSWMKQLKLSYHQKWNDWMLNGDKTFTRAGNMRSPGYGLVIDWISQIWDDLDNELIVRSFKLCGITQNNLEDCHSQLRAFMDEGVMDMVVDDDGTDEIQGFDDEGANDGEDVDIDEESNTESDEDTD